MAMFLLILFGLPGKSASQDNWQKVSDLHPDKYVTIGSLATSPVEVMTIGPSTADSEKPNQHYIVIKFCAKDCSAANLNRVDIVLTDMFNPDFLSYKIKHKGVNLGGATGRSSDDFHLVWTFKQWGTARIIQVECNEQFCDKKFAMNNIDKIDRFTFGSEDTASAYYRVKSTIDETKELEAG